jgi:MFS family permease
MREPLHFLLLNIGHFLDHLFTLIFATVAALALHREWGLGYAELLKYATPGFFAFGVFALPAGWLADKWSREGMMSTFFIGIGLASIARPSRARPSSSRSGLFVVGVFAAIYHPSASPSWWRSGRTRHAHRRQRRVGQPRASPARR